MPLLIPLNWGEMTTRLAIALLVGAMVGLERESREKTAGLRTHMLLSFVAALLVLIPIQAGIFQLNPAGLSWIISSIIAGIGFMGAGVIVHGSRADSEEPGVEGVTSAAAIWVTAALAIAAGCGLWKLALIGAGFSLLILHLFKQVE